MRGLAGRVALVTGATGVIGGAVARRLAAEDAWVAIGSRALARSQAWIQAQDGRKDRYIACQLDVGAPDVVSDTLERLEATAGPPTIFVAAASLREALSAASGAEHANFRRLFEIDVVGHYECARAVVERLPRDTPASLVFLSSVYARVGIDRRIYPEGMAGTPIHYAVVKACIDGLVVNLAAKWAGRPVRVNAVVAGGVENPTRQNDEFVSLYSAKTMLGRLARADEIASAVAFLASDDASYVTGAALVVDGGFTSW